MTDVVIFAVGQEADAETYLAFCNANNPDTTPGATWYPHDRVDKYGQRVVAFMGPTGFTWNNAPFPEPEGGLAARGSGVLNGHVEWPEEP